MSTTSRELPEMMETAKRRGPSTPDLRESEFAQQVARLVAETMLRIQEHRARFEMQVQQLRADLAGVRWRPPLQVIKGGKANSNGS